MASPRQPSPWPAPPAAGEPRRVASLEFDGRLLLVAPAAGQLFVLNETARLIWEALEQGLDAGRAAERLSARFGVSRRRARADVDRMIEGWREAGLLLAPAEPDEPARPRPAAPPARAAAERVYALCRRPVAVRFATRELEALAHPLLAPSETPAARAVATVDLFADGSDLVLAVDGTEVDRAGAEEVALGQLINRLIDLGYPGMRWVAMMHAGAVAGDRHALLLPGASGSGKSTLTAALVGAGLRYLSDDIVPFAAGARILPVPLALSLRAPSWAALEGRFPELARAPMHRDGGHRRYLDLWAHRAPPDALAVAAILFPCYRPGAEVRVQPLTPLEALRRLLASRCWLSLDPDDLSATLSWLSAKASGVLYYDDVEAAVSLALQLLESGHGRDVWETTR